MIQCARTFLDPKKSLNLGNENHDLTFPFIQLF